jgi:hypothetical protein
MYLPDPFSRGPLPEFYTNPTGKANVAAGHEWLV